MRAGPSPGRRSAHQAHVAAAPVQSGRLRLDRRAGLCPGRVRFRKAETWPLSLLSVHLGPAKPRSGTGSRTKVSPAPQLPRLRGGGSSGARATWYGTCAKCLLPTECHARHRSGSLGCVRRGLCTRTARRPRASGTLICTMGITRLLALEGA